MKFLYLTMIVYAAFTSTAQACQEEGMWSKPPNNMPALSIEDATKTLLNEDTVVIEPGPVYGCSSDVLYYVIDWGDHLVLGVIPIPWAETLDGRYLLVRARQLLAIDKSILKSFITADLQFHRESREIAKELGLLFYVPNALPFSTRVSGLNYMVYAKASFCTAPSSYMSKEVFINTIEYIPGRTNYEDETLFQLGDLRKFLLKNDELFNAYVDLVNANAKNCLGVEEQKFWRNLDQRIRTETREQFLKLSPSMALLMNNTKQR